MARDAGEAARSRYIIAIVRLVTEGETGQKISRVKVVLASERLRILAKKQAAID